jgi:hypothetical protein
MIDFPSTELLDDSICLSWLERHRHPDGFACPHCHSHERQLFRPQADVLTYRCHTCDGYSTEGAGAALRTYVRAFRGIHKPYLHRYVATYEAMVNAKRVIPELIQRMCLRNLGAHPNCT